MINWFRKLYNEGRWGFWAIMFLFPIPLIFVFIDAFFLKIETNYSWFSYGWFFFPFIFFGYLHQRELKKKEEDRQKEYEEFNRKRRNK
jgi:hypothetical protein